MNKALSAALVAIALAALSGPAWAQMSALDRMQLADELGTVLGSESACDLTFSQPAIEAFIEKRVPPDDMSFPSTLNMMVQGTEFGITEMSQSSKTAHCTQVRRIAVSYGFVE